jgi:ABC-type lipoprotein export system ATPase subunit
MSDLAAYPLDALVSDHPCVGDFIASLGLRLPNDSPPLAEWLERLADEDLFDAGMERGQVLRHIAQLIDEMAAMARRATAQVTALTLIGGHDKSDAAEGVVLTVRAGEVICIVGPTGSGKSRLLGDIECLAQGDTPTGRRILLDGQTPTAEHRYALERKPVAQLSQNMNFVVDLSARELIALHARCRLAPQGKVANQDTEALVEDVIRCANALTGETFTAETSVTQLSGGQTRALMIADVALLSASPIVLIDEIENAGVDRRRALELLVSGEKIVFISTHDPLLALRGDRRLVIRNGGIAEVLATSAAERANLARIEAMDATLSDIRQRLRSGQRIEEPVLCP